MNENLDLTKILEGCPKGTKFYSITHGEVTFREISMYTDEYYPIRLNWCSKENSLLLLALTKDGRSVYACNGECTLFPSKEQRDWSKFVRFWDKPNIEKFDVNTLQPFDKVLVRDGSQRRWKADFFCCKNEDHEYIKCFCLTFDWNQCIPYNEETKHLCGTTEDCPEYYKWWED